MAQKTKDWLLIILINFMWASQVSVIKLMGDTLGPITIAFVPLIISTLMFLPFLWFENKKRGAAEKRSFKDLKYFLIKLC